MNAIHIPGMLTTREVMQLTGWSQDTLTRRVRAGILQAHRHPVDRRFKVYNEREVRRAVRGEAYA